MILHWLRSVLGKRSPNSPEDRALSERHKRALRKASRALGGDPLLDRLVREADTAMFTTPGDH